MKTRWLGMIVGAVALVIAGAGGATAQNPYGNPYAPPNPGLQQPTVTPYLGLLRRGNSIGFNYITQVRPEMELRKDLARQQVETERLARETARTQQMILNPYTQPGADLLTGASHSIRATGHATGLQNLEGRFMSRSSSAASPGRTGNSSATNRPVNAGAYSALGSATSAAAAVNHLRQGR